MFAEVHLGGLSLSLAGLSLTGLATAAHADPDAAALDRLTREARHCAATVKMGMTEHKRTLAVSRECGRYADMKIMTDCARQGQLCATACRAVYSTAKAGA